MTLLPNLSNLSIGIPQNEDVPKFTVEVRQSNGGAGGAGEASSSTSSTSIPTLRSQTLGILDMYRLFANGAMFSCINKQIIITSTESLEELDSVLFQRLGALDQEDGGDLDVNEDGVSSGSWNLGITVSTADEQAGERDVLGQRAAILWSANMASAQAGVVEPVNKVFVRMSRDNEIFERMYKKMDRNFTKVNQLLFQELYLTLYAAQRGIGVDVYAAIGIPKSYRNAPMLPSVVYLLEAGDGDLNNFCETLQTLPTLPIPSSEQVCKDFYALVERVSNSSMLLVDLKPGNAVYIKRADGGVEFKLIDFGADYSVILPKARFSTRCVHFANCAMFASFVASNNNSGQILAGMQRRESICMARLAYLPYRFVKLYLESMESSSSSSSQSQPDDETLCSALLMARINAKDVPSPFEDSILDMVHEYTREDSMEALISEYLFVYNAYVENKRFRDMKSGRIIRTLFRPGENINLAQPFLKQMLNVVVRRFEEIESIGAFDDLKELSPSGPSDPSDPPHTPPRTANRGDGEEDGEEDKETPLDPWIKDRDGNMDSDYELTPKDKKVVDEEGERKLEEARQVREGIRKREGERGAEERERKRRDLKRTPVRRFEMPNDTELDVLMRG